MPEPGRDISLLFDLHVTSNRVRRLIEGALAAAPLRGDEYAVYSLLFEQAPLTATEMADGLGVPLTTLLDQLRVMESRGHLRRDRHPRDGRAQHLSLTMSGVADHRRTNTEWWEPMRRRLEAALDIPTDEVRRALRSLAAAAAAAREGAVEGLSPTA